MGYRNLHDSICIDVHLLCSDALQGAHASGLYVIKRQSSEEIKQNLQSIALYATEKVADHVISSQSIFTTLVCATTSSNAKEARMTNLGAWIAAKLGEDLAEFLKYFVADKAVFLGILSTNIAGVIIQNSTIQSAAVCYSLELLRKRAA